MATYKSLKYDIGAEISGADSRANAIDSAQYVDGSIDTAHIADDQITDAKLAHAITFVTSATAPAVTATAAIFFFDDISCPLVSTSRYSYSSLTPRHRLPVINRFMLRKVASDP